MTSYLCKIPSSEAIPQDCLPDLAYLVWFGIASVALDVQPFTDAFFPEYVMTSAYSFVKSQA